MNSETTDVRSYYLAHTVAPAPGLTSDQIEVLQKRLPSARGAQRTAIISSLTQAAVQRESARSHRGESDSPMLARSDLDLLLPLSTHGWLKELTRSASDAAQAWYQWVRAAHDGRYDAANELFLSASLQRTEQVALMVPGANELMPDEALAAEVDYDRAALLVAALGDVARTIHDHPAKGTDLIAPMLRSTARDLAWSARMMRLAVEKSAKGHEEEK